VPAAPLLPVAQKQGKQGSLASFAFALHKPKAKVALRVFILISFAFALLQSTYARCA